MFQRPDFRKPNAATGFHQKVRPLEFVPDTRQWTQSTHFLPFQRRGYRKMPPKDRATQIVRNQQSDAEDFRQIRNERQPVLTQLEQLRQASRQQREGVFAMQEIANLVALLPRFMQRNDMEDEKVADAVREAQQALNPSDASSREDEDDRADMLVDAGVIEDLPAAPALPPRPAIDAPNVPTPVPPIPPRPSEVPRPPPLPSQPPRPRAVPAETAVTPAEDETSTPVGPVIRRPGRVPESVRVRPPDRRGKEVELAIQDTLVTPTKDVTETEVLDIAQEASPDIEDRFLQDIDVEMDDDVDQRIMEMKMDIARLERQDLEGPPIPRPMRRVRAAPETPSIDKNLRVEVVPEPAAPEALQLQPVRRRQPTTTAGPFKPPPPRLQVVDNTFPADERKQPGVVAAPPAPRTIFTTRPGRRTAGVLPPRPPPQQQGRRGRVRPRDDEASALLQEPPATRRRFINPEETIVDDQSEAIQRALGRQPDPAAGIDLDDLVAQIPPGPAQAPPAFEEQFKVRDVEVRDEEKEPDEPAKVRDVLFQEPVEQVAQQLRRAQKPRAPRPELSAQEIEAFGELEPKRPRVQTESARSRRIRGSGPARTIDALADDVRAAMKFNRAIVNRDEAHRPSRRNPKLTRRDEHRALHRLLALTRGNVVVGSSFFDPRHVEAQDRDLAFTLWLNARHALSNPDFHIRDAEGHFIPTSALRRALQTGRAELNLVTRRLSG